MYDVLLKLLYLWELVEEIGSGGGFKDIKMLGKPKKRGYQVLWQDLSPNKIDIKFAS